jgi:hypothetical protein
LNKLLYSTSDLKITVKEIQFSIRFIHKLQPLIYIYIFFFCVTAPAVAFKAAEGSMHGALSDQKQHSEKIRCHQYGGGRGGLLLSLIIPFLQKEVLSIMLKGRGKHYSPHTYK